MYVITVLEQVGDTVIMGNYYNYGTYSDLWRATKSVQAQVTLPRVLMATDTERWAAMLSPLLLHLQPLCPHSIRSAYVQISVHLSRALRTDSRSLSIPVECTERLDLWRLYVSFLAACPPYANANRPPAVMSCEEVRNHLLAILKGDVELHIQIAQAALGCCHPEHLPYVLQVCVRDSACMHVRANGQQHLYCGCTVSAGGFANISISSARVRWTVVNDNRP
jgi:hypothetical protein